MPDRDGMDTTPASTAATLAAGEIVTWAIAPDVLQQLHRAAAAGVRDLQGNTPPEARLRKAGGQGGAVAVIPIQGVIRKRISFLEMLFGAGGSTIGRIRSQLREALADDSVSSIVLHVESPGGTVGGIPELADEIRAARDAKPIVAVADSYAASAAYWLGAQATELLVTPSGSVGSIGVFAEHTDWSKFDENLGINTTLVFAGKHKVDGNPYEPLSDDARADMQATVDAYHDMFLQAVANGRGTTVDNVADNYGQGRMLLAEDAVAAGMADAVATFDDAIGRAADLSAAGSRRGSSASRAEDVERVISDDQLLRAFGINPSGDVDAQVAALLSQPTATDDDPAPEPAPQTTSDDPFEAIDPDAVAASPSLRKALRAVRA